MAFQKGQSGNPGGRTKDKPWVDALRLAVMSDDRRKLRAIADKCVTAAIGGDMQAIKEIGDRLDGKPAQESTVTVHRGANELTDQEIAARIAELRGIGASGNDDQTPIDPSQLN